MKFINDIVEDIAWCPGCGNFALRTIMAEALEELGWEPNEVVLVSGIGQAAKMPQYLRSHMFNGLHGRALPVAMAIKASNPGLKVIVHSGDGCNYGEGGNHFTHQILRNSDINVIAHNNMIYGLTKGQGSPTSPIGLKTTVQVFGVTNRPFNPIAAAIAQDASFVARIFVGFKEHAKNVIKKGLQHKGFTLIDTFCPCISFNKLNTYKWYKDNSYIMENHDTSDKKAAILKALEEGPFPLGIFYEKNESDSTQYKTFSENSEAYKSDKRPLYERSAEIEKLQRILETKTG